jgi:hypothetical protein
MCVLVAWCPWLCQLFRVGAFGLLFFRPLLDRWFALTRDDVSRALDRPLMTAVDRAHLHSLLQLHGLMALTVVTEAAFALEPLVVGADGAVTVPSAVPVGAGSGAGVDAGGTGSTQRQPLSLAIKKAQSKRGAKQRDADTSAAGGSGGGGGSGDGPASPTRAPPALFTNRCNRAARQARAWLASKTGAACWRFVINEVLQWKAQGLRFDKLLLPRDARTPPLTCLRDCAVVSAGVNHTMQTALSHVSSAVTLEQVVVGPLVPLPLAGAAQMLTSGVTCALDFKHMTSRRTYRYAVLEMLLRDVPPPALPGKSSTEKLADVQCSAGVVHLSLAADGTARSVTTCSCRGPHPQPHLQGVVVVVVMLL